MSLRKHFANNIKNLREDRGWSQEQLASVSGLHRTYISGIERSVRNPTLEIIELLANAFDVTASRLLEEKN